LINRLVIALNKKPKHGLGHSIALGVQVALQFKPDAIVICMSDMPFIEGWLIEALLAKLGDADIVHAGAAERVHPPTAFGAACFDQLKALDGDDGAKRIIGQGGFRVTGLNAPAPILVDVDSREELDFAKRQLALRNEIALRASRPASHAGAPMEPTPDPVPLSRLSINRR
jgi:CTP:molybdopterin cytidylyltransferase MocA